MISFELREGIHPVSCARCGQEMQVEVYRHEGELKIRTAARGTVDRAKSERS
jgi:hypothetical protein